MDNMGIAVASLDKAIAFFSEIGLNLLGRTLIEGDWAGKVTGLEKQLVEIAMMVTPDGHSRLELCQFHYPEILEDHRQAPVNALGYMRAMFTVTHLEALVARLELMGATLVGAIVVYEQAYKLCYIRGIEGLLIGLAEEIRV
jgi:catechol 2,3-dioxygenase-like lactoylglutathione lyase family enzyme